nr:hypothetical protein [Candidatus Cloacimonadota bacterium]
MKLISLLRITNFVTLLVLFLGTVNVLSGQTTYLTLEECRAKAIAHNKILQAAQAQQQSAQSTRKASFTQFFPRVHTLGSYTYVDENIDYTMDLPIAELLQGLAISNPAIVSDPFYATLLGMQTQGYLPDEYSLSIGKENNWIFDVTLTQPIFTGGKLIQQYKISKSAEKISDASLQKTGNELIYQTDEAYWRLVNISAKYALANDYQALVQTLLSQVQNAYDAGVTTQNDLLKVQVKLNEAELMSFKAKNGVHLATMALNQIIGEPIESSIALPVTLSEIPYVPYDSTKVQEYIENRPEVLILKQEMEIKQSLTKIEQSRYFPNIALQASANYQNPNPYDSFEADFGHNWQVGIVAQWELFDFNARKHTISATKHQQQSTQLILEQSKELFELEIKQAELQYKEALKRIQLSEKSVSQAEENLRITQNRFDEGMCKSSDVLEAQVSWLNAKTELIEAQTDLYTKRANLEKTLSLLY